MCVDKYVCTHRQQINKSIGLYQANKTEGGELEKEQKIQQNKKQRG